MIRSAVLLPAFACGALGAGCDSHPQSYVVVDNDYPSSSARGSALTQDQADFITQLVFPRVFAKVHYDAATCTTTPLGDGGTP